VRVEDRAASRPSPFERHEAGGRTAAEGVGRGTGRDGADRWAHSPPSRDGGVERVSERVARGWLAR